MVTGARHMKHRAISLHQPWASLLFPTSLDYQCPNCRASFSLPLGMHCDDHRPELPAPLKQWETRSRPAPSTIIGKRILIHAAKATPDLTAITAVNRAASDTVRCTSVGDPRRHESWRFIRAGQSTMEHLPFGALLGWVTITESLPIDGNNEDDHLRFICPHVGGGLTHYEFGNGGNHGPTRFDDITDQTPFGDWTDGRHAWCVTNPVLLPEPIPYRGQQGVFFVDPEVLS